MIFERHDIIKHEGKMYIAICVDEYTAVFAHIRKIKKHNCTRTSYSKLFAVSNSKEFEDTFKYERVRIDEE